MPGSGHLCAKEKNTERKNANAGVQRGKLFTIIKWVAGEGLSEKVSEQKVES